MRRRDHSDGFGTGELYPEEIAVEFVRRVWRETRGTDSAGIAHRSLLRDLIPGLVRSGRPFASELASFAYGDTPPGAIYRLLRWAGAEAGDSFLDLGCGCGIPVLVASFLVESARGVDRLPGVIEAARASARRLERPNVCFEVADIANVQVTESLVYLTATAMTPRLMAAATLAVAAASAGTRILAVDRPLEHPLLPTVASRWYRFPWSGGGEGTKHEVFLQERVNPCSPASCSD